MFDYIELNVDAKSPVLIKPCPFLKNGKCEVHEIRPKSCKDFPLTERGNCGVGCEGYREIKERVKKIESAVGKLEFVRIEHDSD